MILVTLAFLSSQMSTGTCKVCIITAKHAVALLTLTPLNKQMIEFATGEIFNLYFSGACIETGANVV